VSQRCVTCALEARGKDGVYCSQTGETILLEDRLKPNGCAEYRRVDNAISTPPYPLREPRRGP
jgi:hypothetical protein